MNLLKHSLALSLSALLFGVEWSISQCQKYRETRASNAASFLAGENLDFLKENLNKRYNSRPRFSIIRIYIQKISLVRSTDVRSSRI